MALADTYHTKLQEFLALQKPDKISCYQELKCLHSQLHGGNDLVLPPIVPMAAGVIYDSQIVGVYYAKSGKVLATIPKFTELLLVPDPNNPNDPKAVKILVGKIRLGYVPKVINKPVFFALISKKKVICLMGKHIPAIEKNNDFSPERATITIHIIAEARFQRLFTNLMDIYELTFPQLPENWPQAMAALGEVVIPMLENYLRFHPEISARELVALVKSQFGSQGK